MLSQLRKSIFAQIDVTYMTTLQSNNAQIGYAGIPSALPPILPTNPPVVPPVLPANTPAAYPPYKMADLKDCCDRYEPIGGGIGLCKNCHQVKGYHQWRGPPIINAPSYFQQPPREKIPESHPEEFETYASLDPWRIGSRDIRYGIVYGLLHDLIRRIKNSEQPASKELILGWMEEWINEKKEDIRIGYDIKTWSGAFYRSVILLIDQTFPVISRTPLQENYITEAALIDESDITNKVTAVWLQK